MKRRDLDAASHRESPMLDVERDQLLAECLEDYHRRRALGESPEAEEYRDRAGNFYPEFVEVLAAESAIDEALTPSLPTSLPATFGEYTLLREIGRGAVGVVYEALERRLDRKVAIKILRTSFDTEAVALERFRREARACARVEHPHLVRIHGSGEVEGRPYYSMELLPGSPLSILIKEGRLPPSRALFTGLASVADALHALHQAGIVHRDVKPSNILVSPEGRMVLADFGLARSALATTLTSTGEALGTPLYMSPEQLEGAKEVDGRSDVYGLGATFYECLTGRPPYKSEDWAELWRMVRVSRPEAVRSLNPQVPVRVEWVAMKAIEKDKADRYQSCLELREDLVALAEDRAPDGRPVSAFVRWVRTARSHALKVAALVLLGVGLAVGGFALWYANQPARLIVNEPVGWQFLLDGHVVGVIPLVVETEPGVHRWSLAKEGFQAEQTQEIVLARRERELTTHALRQPDKNSEQVAEAIQEAGSSLGGRVVLERPEDLQRTLPRPPAIQALLPRGYVRAKDLAHGWRLGMDAAEELDGTVQFRRGDAVLFAAPVQGSEDVLRGKVPAEAVAQMRPGDRITWGYWPRRGDPVTATFDVVADALAGTEARMDQVYANQEGSLTEQIRTHVYLSAQLNYAAYETALALVDAEEAAKGQGLVLPWAYAHQALLNLGLEESKARLDVRDLLLDGLKDRLDTVYPRSAGASR